MRNARPPRAPAAIIDRLIAHLARDGSSARLAEVYLRQGDLSTLLKRFDAADRALTTALRIGQEREDTTLVRSGLRSLGLLRWHEGRHAEAVEIARRALALDRECGDDLAVAVDLTNLGNILKATGDHRGARTSARRGARDAGCSGPTRRSSSTRSTIWRTSTARQATSIAPSSVLPQSDEIARVHLLPIQRSFHLTSIAHIQLQQGRIDVALDTYRRSGRSQPAARSMPKASCSRCGCSATRSSASRDTRRRCRACRKPRSSSRNWKTAAPRRRCGPESPSSSSGRHPTRPRRRGTSCSICSARAGIREAN